MDKLIENLEKSLSHNVITLEDAKHLTSKFPSYLHIVGSVIRKKAFPGDIDIVSDKPLDDVRKYFDKYYKVLKMTKGDRKMDIHLIAGKYPIKFNIWYSKPEEFPFMILAYSYTRQFNIYMRKEAEKQGMKLSQYGLYKDGKLVKIKSVRDIFRKLGIEYRTPEEDQKRKDIKDARVKF